MADTKTYLYSVSPRKTITGLSNVAAFRSPKSLFLTLEDVKICLEKATVYRRFANEGRVEKVTIGNYERLHNDVFMTEEEYNEFKKHEPGKNASTVKKEEPPKTSDTALDDKKEAEPVKESAPVEEKKEGSAIVSEDDKADEKADESKDEELYESDEDEEVLKDEEAAEED